MARKGLNREIILKNAVIMLEAYGYEEFSMRELAAELGVQVSSLYNHVKNVEELFTDIGIYAVQKFLAAVSEQKQSDNPEKQITALAKAFRSFVQNNKELYRVMIHTDRKAMRDIDTLFGKSIADFGITEHDRLYWGKTLLSLLYGFVIQENSIAETMQDDMLDRSFDIALQCYIDGIHTALKQEKMGMHYE